MILTLLRGENIKGIDFSHEMFPITIFTGENAAGKTARLEAARLVAIGYLPRRGKLHSATLRLAGPGDSMEVAGEFGTEIIRRKWKKGKECKREGSSECLVPEILVDQSEFMALSGNKRVDYLFSAVHGASVDKVSEVVRALRGLDLKDRNEKSIDVLTAIVDWIYESGRIWKQAVAEQGDARTFQAWLEEVISETQEELKVTKQNVDRLSKTIAALPQVTDVESVDLNTAQAELATVRAELMSLKGKIGEFKSRWETNRNNAATLTRLRDSLAALPTGKPLDAAAELALLSERDGLTAECAKIRESIRQGDARFQTETRRQRVRIEAESELKRYPDHSSEISALNSELYAVSTEAAAISGSQARIGQLRSLMQLSIKTVKALRSQLETIKNNADQLLGSESCPTCGSAGSVWKAKFQEDVKSQVADLTGRITTLEEESGANELSLREESSRLEAASIAVERQRKIHARIEELNRAQNDRRSAEARLSNTPQPDIEWMNGWAAEAPVLESRLGDLLFTLGEVRRKISEQEQSKASEAERSNLMARIEAIPPIEVVDMAPLYEMEIKLTMRSEVLDSQVSKAVANRQNSNIRREAVDQLDEAKTRLSVLKSVIGGLEGARANVVSSLIGPVIDHANRIIRGRLPSPLVIIDGEIGCLTMPRHFVSADEFSGMQSAVTMAALGLALAGKDCRWKVLIVDELGNFSAKNKRQFMADVAELIRVGDLDQFIGADVSELSIDGVHNISV